MMDDIDEKDKLMMGGALEYWREIKTRNHLLYCIVLVANLR
jgi:hypothetical protein